MAISFRSVISEVFAEDSTLLLKKREIHVLGVAGFLGSPPERRSKHRVIARPTDEDMATFGYN